MLYKTKKELNEAIGAIASRIFNLEEKIESLIKHNEQILFKERNKPKFKIDDKVKCFIDDTGCPLIGVVEDVGLCYIYDHSQLPELYKRTLSDQFDNDIVIRDNKGKDIGDLNVKSYYYKYKIKNNNNKSVLIKQYSNGYYKTEWKELHSYYVVECNVHKCK